MGEENIVAEPLENDQRLNGGNEDYKSWSHEGLIRRVEQLERELKEKNSSIIQQTVPIPPPTPLGKHQKKAKRNPNRFDASKYSTRLIALKLSYLGKDYNGFEHHINNTTPLPTIEEELWAALMKAHLIFPVMSEEKRQKFDAGGLGEGCSAKGVEVNWEGCEYSKCGRTDKGVSAFGQVIGTRVRSNRPLGKRKSPAKEEHLDKLELEHRALPLTSDTLPPTYPAGVRKLSSSSPISDEETDCSDALDFDPIKDELPYAAILNRILPPTIRILAWCPSPPLDFSARFSCRERQYRYFFTQPAYCPSPLSMNPVSSQLGNGDEGEMVNRGVPDGWLDIAAMRTAAKLFEGTHDFRNFCKVDGGKQISNFSRDVFKADIEEVLPHESGPGFAFTENFLPDSISKTYVGGDGKGAMPKIYTFTLHGSAFLWHQVRHMIAILFLVGQGLEAPSIVSTLLNTSLVPSRPRYEMAEDTPLVLSDCVFPAKGDRERKEALQWLWVGHDVVDKKWGGNGCLMDDCWRVWRGRCIDATLAGCLLQLVSTQGSSQSNSVTSSSNVVNGNGNGNGEIPKPKSKSQKLFDGGDLGRLVGKYTPVLKKERLESPEEVNERYAKRKGFAGSAEMREALSGFRRPNPGFRGLGLGDGGVDGVDVE